MHTVPQTHFISTAVYFLAALHGLHLLWFLSLGVGRTAGGLWGQRQQHAHAFDDVDDVVVDDVDVDDDVDEGDHYGEDLGQSGGLWRQRQQLAHGFGHQHQSASSVSSFLFSQKPPIPLSIDLPSPRPKGPPRPKK